MDTTTERYDELKNDKTRADGSLPRPWYELWTRKFFNAVLACGPLPKHIGFIMDGNRRFAQKKSMEKIVGHTMGFNKLKEALEWCLELGVEVVTVYAFSMENFKRSPEEVSALMRLAAEKFEELLNQEDIIHKHGVSIRVLGDISLVPDYLQHSMATAIHNTRNNSKYLEMVTAAQTLSAGVQEGLINVEDINGDLLEECMYTSGCPPLDILIRTSGEKRLSDFLLWQSAHCCLSFVDVLWPEFSAWDLYRTILFYQQNHAHIKERREAYERTKRQSQKELDLHELQKGSGGIASLHGALEKVEAERVQRTQHFLGVARQRQSDLIAGLCTQEEALRQQERN
ncbi:dehydrodolichyl diphosphate synthase [Acanthamoeba castellanii str. Neff]|uniref:Alkyl transferase n=1 Tax=Acanthamoeba castellanii (strain ATCC 30010 / Neff) TaxID=1257118 RepID=L8H007_ACACF|nr:dehydrodolichyl diphosphate synthase [Acanthamoeba castellanii str. Neff]ELR18859.1 dehydrodolichyl diphosphate synthase [Acanthamoeba castellanii str. Neff]